MNYFATLGKPETDLLRIELREQQAVSVKAVAARNAATERKADPAEIQALTEQAQAAGRAYSEILDQLVSRPYVRASRVEPAVDEPEPMNDEFGED